ncbi:MAG TPA: M48 family metallopeptidase [Candidatus Diapherotrites archaeon]|nr:M48 family metallopeptidase [Candidatus Diapherotrites archaeon]
MGRRVINELYSQEYEHPFDKRALDALEQTPGLETLVRKFNQYWNDKVLKIQYTGSNIKVTDRNFPGIYDALKEACRILNVPKLPDLYIQWSYDINAFTAGVESPIIVLNTGTIDLLTYEEILFIIGHELGHIKSQHVLYNQMAQVLPVLGNIVGSATLGIGSLISTGLQIAILNWSRMSEFTADRAGILACQDVNSAVSAMVKIAGVPQKYFDSINIDDFIQQAKEFESYDYDSLDKMAKIISIMWQNHPWTVMRAAEFFKWIDSGQYDNILNRNNHNNHMTVNPKPMFCSECGNKLRGNERFCTKCGKCFDAGYSS